MLYRLGALPAAEIEALLEERRPELKAPQRALTARLAEGAVGRALTLDLETYLASRKDALLVLRSTLREPDYSELFRATETYRGGADGQEKTINLLRARRRGYVAWAAGGAGAVGSRRLRRPRMRRSIVTSG